MLRFDPDRDAIINPNDLVAKIPNFPETVISCFERKTFSNFLDSVEHEEIARTSTANLEIPIYRYWYKGKAFACFNSYVGSAACVAILEDLIAMGMKNLVIFGTCGVLDRSIKETSIIIPTHAFRDEGTSYHYAKKSQEISLNHTIQKRFKSFLEHREISYTEGKVWTTDAIYRETSGKLEYFKNKGAICVDMECSAVAALCQFREIQHLHFFYSADNLDNEKWETRSLGNTIDSAKKHRISQLAKEFADEIF